MNAQDYDHKRLANARKAAGLTQDQLAEQLGVTSVTISRVETGVSASYGLLTRIATQLGRSVTEFLHEKSVEDKNFSPTT